MLELWYVNSVMIDNVNQFQRALPLLFHSSLGQSHSEYQSFLSFQTPNPRIQSAWGFYVNELTHLFTQVQAR
jgi:hypothetical protein